MTQTANMKTFSQVVQKFPIQCIERQVMSTFRTRPVGVCRDWAKVYRFFNRRPTQIRGFSITSPISGRASDDVQKDDIKHDGSLDEKLGESKMLQTRTPWHREGADKPPVSRMRSAGAMTKGTGRLAQHHAATTPDS